MKLTVKTKSGEIYEIEDGKIEIKDKPTYVMSDNFIVDIEDIKKQAIKDYLESNAFEQGRFETKEQIKKQAIKEFAEKIMKIREIHGYGGHFMNMPNYIISFDNFKRVLKEYDINL